MPYRRAPAHITDIRTGTMGWSYEDWRGPFYPTGLPASRMLSTYARVFDTVEVDSTFYGVPRPATVSSWAAQTPPTFLFSAKVPRAVTHERRLIGGEETALHFASLMREHLDKRLGALLLQMPPDFTSDERPSLEKFLDNVTRSRGEPDLPWVIELRSESWLETDIADSLTARGLRCVTSERLDLGAPITYLRLLGLENAFPRFDETQIDRAPEIVQWAQRIDSLRFSPEAPPLILVFIRNFFEGHAPASLLALRSHLGLSVPTPPGKQQLSLF